MNAGPEDQMKIPALLPLGAALLLGTATAPDVRAQGVFFNWQLVPGPSGYRGPFVTGPDLSYRQAPPARPTTQQAPVTMRERSSDRTAIVIGHGEPDETGRIGPTFQAERDADGKLLPTYRPP